MILRVAHKLTLSLCMFAVVMAHAQQDPAGQPDADGGNPPHAANRPAHVTMFPHSDDQRWLVSGQANIIFQAHPGFHSPYSGTNSMLARGEYKTSLVGTLFTGLELHGNARYNTDAIFDLESTGGRGISEALGLAGFTNLDVVRNPNLGPKPYVARAEIHQTIGLTSKMVEAQRTQFSLATKVPDRRFELRVGKLSLPDIFDQNTPGSDSHLQFLNWTVDNNGAYDYAADTRGYTYAAVLEYDDGPWAVRYGMALMPTVANGIDLQSSLRKARGDNYEIDYGRGPLARWLDPKRQGAVRLVGYVNHANMGDYRQQNIKALQERASGNAAATPVITDHPFGTTVKYGVGLNFEQELPKDLRVFGRFGWNEGQHESYAYTEVDQTFEVGGDLAGNRWSRPNDRVGVVVVSNAIKRDHQAYLGLGGLGFLLGDGRLNYAREDILESYYTAHNWRGLFSSFDFQFIEHPGYNQDRGPVGVFSVRTHVDF
ncbi:MAG TPA: carbohydrate porin [Acidobacteriaceae bacterium]|nr:carbohydrate porin [Acidobacteriaceae bacterium]